MDPQALLLSFLANAPTDPDSRADKARNYAEWLARGGSPAEVIVTSRQCAGVTLLGRVLRIAPRTGRLLVRTYAADGSTWCRWRTGAEVASVPKTSTARASA